MRWLGVLGVLLGGLWLAGCGGDEAPVVVQPPVVDEFLPPPAETPAKVLLIGDSITFGYWPETKRLLQGKALVTWTGNGSNTAYGLQRLDFFLQGQHWDVIHVNFGLHDIRLDTGQVAVSPTEYAANLHAIVQRLRATRTRLIWAMTTPVPAERPYMITINSDVLRYNEIARQVMTAEHVPINDLYAYINPDLATYQIPKDVHFTVAGYAHLAIPVAAAIEAALR
jgi:lysophospholipase L1-like esterase